MIAMKRTLVVSNDIIRNMALSFVKNMQNFYLKDDFVDFPFDFEVKSYKSLGDNRHTIRFLIDSKGFLFETPKINFYSGKNGKLTSFTMENNCRSFHCTEC